MEQDAGLHHRIVKGTQRRPGLSRIPFRGLGVRQLAVPDIETVGTSSSLVSGLPLAADTKTHGIQDPLHARSSTGYDTEKHFPFPAPVLVTSLCIAHSSSFSIFAGDE